MKFIRLRAVYSAKSVLNELLSPYILNHFLFLFQNIPKLVATINFDRTGTIKIGKYVLNRSFMLPGLVTTFTTACVGLVMVYLNLLTSVLPFVNSECKK